MQVTELNNISKPKCEPKESAPSREVLKLSDLDADLMSDLTGMFGKWFEADHCDIDGR